MPPRPVASLRIAEQPPAELPPSDHSRIRPCPQAQAQFDAADLRPEMWPVRPVDRTSDELGDRQPGAIGFDLQKHVLPVGQRDLRSATQRASATVDGSIDVDVPRRNSHGCPKTVTSRAQDARAQKGKRWTSA